MSISFADFPDLKFFRLIKSEVFSAPVGASKYIKTFRSDRIILLAELKIALSLTTNTVIDGVLIDDQAIVDVALGPNNTNLLINNLNGAQNSANAFSSGLLVPLRESIKINFNNASAAAENQTINAWGYIAEVAADKFSGRASLQQV
ncbi:MAG: hypothetical protein ACREBO_14085 [Novosphingobium sp.]